MIFKQGDTVKFKDHLCYGSSLDYIVKKDSNLMVTVIYNRIDPSREISAWTEDLQGFNDRDVLLVLL